MSKIKDIAKSVFDVAGDGLTGGLMGLGTNLGNKLVGLIPDKMTEKEKMEFTAVIDRELREFSLDQREKSIKEQEQFYDFIDSYEGASKDNPRWVQIIRSLIRPCLTVAIMGAYLFAFMKPNIFTKDQLNMLFPLTLLVLAFWFGERSLKNLGVVEAFKNKGGSDG